jgi:DNA (cytosine-5)-methyltransferase 1
MSKIHGLDLFSGIGGIGIGLGDWVRTVAYCEQNKYAQGVLLSRMQSGDIDRAPIWDDVQTLSKQHLQRIDIIFGGFPCQDISTAGTGKGLAGERSGLFFEVVRLVSELRPSFLFLENVSAITVRGLERITMEITALGYDCRWLVISAEAVGANHRRERWFCLAHSNSGRRQQRNAEIGSFSEFNETGSEISNTSLQRPQIREKQRPTKRPIERTDWWSIEPDVGRVVDGLPFRVDRIKCLGNSVVPLQVKTAFERLSGLK